MASQVSQQAQGSERPSTADLIDRLSRFDGPPELFLVNLLAVQCHLAAAEGGAVLRAAGAEGQTEVLAVYPPVQEGATAPVWLASAVEGSGEVLSSGQTAIKPLHGADDLYGAQTKRYLVLVPLRSEGGVRGLTAFVVQPANRAGLEASCERIEITVSLLSLYEMRLTLQRRNMDLQRVRVAMETLAAVNEHNRFAGAAMAMCNEAATRWNADRVSLGFLKGRYVHLKAMSHTEKFSRKMKLVQDIESTMEECLDQDVEVMYPSSPQETYVSRAAGELAKKHGPSTVLSMPLRRDGEVKAVLSLERPADEPFELEEVESLRLTGELCTARLTGLHETDRWFGARMAVSARTAVSSFLGPKHTWLKVAAIGIFCLIVFLAFAKGEYKVEAPFVFEAMERRVVPAPYDSELKGVRVKSGQVVKAGEVLAVLKTRELELQLAQAEAEYAVAVRSAGEAKAADERAKAQMARQQARRHMASIKLLQHRVDQGNVTSPIDGVVLTPDLDKLVGGPVEKGKILFEVAPLGEMWAELSVAEDQIGDVKPAMTGELAPVGMPGRRIEFVVERNTPMAEVVDQRNVFKVRVALKGFDSQGVHRGLYPGAEGVAKITVDRRRYAWIWTRKLVNWLRMKLWL